MAFANNDSSSAHAKRPEDAKWKFRDPPTGLTSHEFRLCQQFDKVRTCRLGLQCVEAHSREELAEWVSRWELLKDQVNRKMEKAVSSQTFLQKLQLAGNQNSDAGSLFVAGLPHVQVQVEDEAFVTCCTKPATAKWTVWVKSRDALRNAALLEDGHREHFTIHGVVSSNQSRQEHLERQPGLINKNRQEWNGNTGEPPGLIGITVKFRANVYGSFSQTVVLDFGQEQYVTKQLRVDVYPSKEGLELSEDGKQLVVSSESQWTDKNATIVRLPPSVWEEHSTALRQRYPHPGQKMALPLLLDASPIGAANYRQRMHALLDVEELAQARILAHFNLTGNVILTTHYILSPGPLSTAKYCNGVNELFAKLDLSVKISEDSPAGRLILNNCNLALLSFGLDSQGKRRAYECVIEDKTKNAIYLRLHEQLVADFQLKHGSEFRVQAQFQLNRDVFCEKHWAVDLCTPEILFPDASIPMRAESFHAVLPESAQQLNMQQKQAVTAICSSPGTRRAPIVIAGPYGTGKTFTFAQCIMGILDQPNTRVLVCTHSNSAADLYVKDYLHPLVQGGMSHYRPLRIFYRVRWLATVHHSVIEYSLLETDPAKGSSFRMPKLEDIEQHRIVVTTLATTSYLLQAGVKRGYFTHILIDEAAQCTECDVLIPLSLADERTRIALAGDHMQLSPEVFSQLAREQLFQVSLLERLYDRYPAEFPCRIVLCDNYRSHAAIVKFTSELFYDNRLKSVGVNEQHPEFYPLTFQVAKGQDVQDSNSTSIFNMAEIYEVGEVVKKLQDTWPSDSWGKLDENSIGIVSPYSDQVSRIRIHLRHSKLFGVNVERVLNVQGKQFRVIILSTVRTRDTCINSDKEKKRKTKNILKVNAVKRESKQNGEDNVSDEEEEEDQVEDEEAQFGFLSSARLLNTAVTRARSLVVVVGDPLAMCSVGKCRKLWEKYIEVCRDFNSLNGIDWSQLRSHLDALELKKLYGLNPMAAEFVPSKVTRVRLPLIMPPQPLRPNIPRPPYHPCRPPVSSPTAAVASIGVAAAPVTAGTFAPFRPPPAFHAQPFILPHSPRRQQQSQQQQQQQHYQQHSHAQHGHPPPVEPRAMARPPQMIPPPLKPHMNIPNGAQPPVRPIAVPPPPVVSRPPLFVDFSPFPQLNQSFQNVQLTTPPKVPPAGHVPLHELHALRGYDISYAMPALHEPPPLPITSRPEPPQASATNPAQAGTISKPLTVQQLEASLLHQRMAKGQQPVHHQQQPHQPQQQQRHHHHPHHHHQQQQVHQQQQQKQQQYEANENWPSSPTNGSIWTPLSGPSLWDGAIFSKDDEAAKNDKVPLYLRTAANMSQIADSESERFPPTAPGLGSDEEDIPLWADGNDMLDEDLDDLLEGKTLQFEESVLRSLRRENLID